jgi:hypothetical protein
MVHRTKWIWGAFTVASLLLLAFIAWLVDQSAQFYSSPTRRTTSPITTPHRSVNRVDDASLMIDGPVHLELELGRLEEGERVIVARDLTKILEDRLRRVGSPVAASGKHVLVVNYREERGQPLDVRVPDGKGQRTVESVPTTRIVLGLTLDRPGRPLRSFGQRAFSSAATRLEMSVLPTQQALQRQRRQLYQQTYQAALEYLRTVELIERRK